MKTVKIAAIVLASLFAIPAFAQNTNTPNVDKREANQQGRIANGINSGALTAKEAGNLEKREAKIATDEQAAKADGKVTKAERAKLQHEENKASRKIYKKKHNASATTPTN
jgi:Skp family chaperone for outer membrane proteins